MLRYVNMENYTQIDAFVGKMKIKNKNYPRTNRKKLQLQEEKNYSVYITPENL